MTKPSPPRTILPIVLTFASVLACAEDIGADTQEMEEESAESADEEDNLITHDVADGVTRTVVDSTDEEAWIYLDLDDAAAAGEGSGELDEGESGWDLGLRRFEIKLNGGSSGDASVEVAYSDSVAFGSVKELPQGLTWIQDGDALDEEGQPILAFGDWYDYDVMTHTLSPKERTYFIRTTDDAIYKLGLLDYYSDAGSPGFLSFQWSAL